MGRGPRRLGRRLPAKRLAKPLHVVSLSPVRDRLAFALEEIRVDIGSRDLARQLQLPADAEGRQAQLRLFRSEGGRGERARRHRPLAVLAEGAARKSAAARGWAHRHLRRHSRRGRVAGDAEERARDRLPPGARADAGFHRRSRRGRSCRHARRHARAWRRPAQDQSAGPGRPRHRPLGDGRHVRHGSCVPRTNVEMEYERNGERYAFLRWGAGAFDNFRVVPPGTGICHQVNLEYLAQTRVDQEGRTAAAGRLPRYAGRHRQPHHHGQRPRACSAGASAASRPRPPCSASRSPC